MGAPHDTAENRLLRKLVRSEVNQFNDVYCLEWMGSRNRTNYGVIRDAGGDQILTHRLAHLLWIGEIPEGFVVDHLCENRPCCEPTHIEAVTFKTNIQRASRGNAKKTHCTAGHPYDEVNTYYWTRPGGGRTRSCRECMKRRSRDAYHARQPIST